MMEEPPVKKEKKKRLCTRKVTQIYQQKSKTKSGPTWFLLQSPKVDAPLLQSIRWPARAASTSKPIIPPDHLKLDLHQQISIAVKQSSNLSSTSGAFHWVTTRKGQRDKSWDGFGSNHHFLAMTTGLCFSIYRLKSEPQHYRSLIVASASISRLQ